MALVAVEINLLGPPRVRRDGEPVRFDTRKAVALLAHLALVESPRSRDSLCELLWPGRDPDRARGALRRTLSTLRAAIGEEWVETAGDAIALREGAELELDVARFRARAAEASAESLSEAVELFAGDFLEGFALRDSPEFDHWQMGEADVLRRELGSALRRLVELQMERGAHEPALRFAERWVEIEPLHEPAHRELIRLYALTGDRGAALQQYRQCVRALSQELGVAPLEETTALFEQVSEGTLAPVLAVPPNAEDRVLPDAPRELPLVGRDSELDALLAAHGAAAEGGVLAVVEGEAGIGKTRLCLELGTRVRAKGSLVIAAQCHEDEAGLPYAPIVALLSDAVRTAEDWVGEVSPQRLADASRLHPELAALRPDLPKPHSLSAPGVQIRLLEAVAAVLDAAGSGPAPGVLFLDDVHAADEATVDFLAYLGRRLDQRPMLLLLSWRSEAVPPDHRLRRLRVDREHEDARIVRLDRLDRADVSALVNAADPSGTAEVQDRIFRESEGLPLFVTEYVLAAQAGDVTVGQAVPTEAHTFLGARMSGVGAVARQVLGAAAAIGRSFDFETVLAASGRSDEEAVAALEELVEHGLVRQADTADARYEFSHQILRELVYEETSPARRGLLHRRIAASLPRSGETAALTAQQLRLAGEPREAAEEFRIAAEHAASLLAHADAIAHLDTALALDPPDAAGLHERIGDLRTLVGDYGGALAELRVGSGREPGVEAGGARAEAGRRPRATRRLGALRGAARGRTRLGAPGGQRIASPHRRRPCALASPLRSDRRRRREGRRGARAGRGGR